MVTLGSNPGWLQPGKDKVFGTADDIPGTPDQQAGTFMHELGHTLGLQHGGDQVDLGPDGLANSGDENVYRYNYKPNYHSVMNYTWQVPQTNYVGWVLDYSREQLPSLDENNLNEVDGIGGHATAKDAAGNVVPVTVPVGPLPARIVNESGPVDWSRNDSNNDGFLTNDTSVMADINHIGVLGLGPASPSDVLSGYNDWPNLQYFPRDNNSFADGAFIGDAVDDEMTFEIYQELGSIRGPAVSVTPTSGLVTAETGSGATFRVVLNAAPSADVTIGLSSSNTAEGTVSPSSLTFTTTNWNVPQMVTVTGVDDQLDDGNVAYTIVTTAASSSDSQYDHRNVDDVSITSTDDDTAGLVQFDQAAVSVAKDGGSITIKVNRTGGAASGVTVDYATSDGTAHAGTDYTASAGTLTFGAGDTTHSFIIPILNNTIATGRRRST